MEYKENDQIRVSTNLLDSFKVVLFIGDISAGEAATRIDRL